MQPAAPRRPWAPVHIAATCASAALLFGSISLSMVQMAVPGAANAAPVGLGTGTPPQTEVPKYFSIANYANSPLVEFVPAAVTFNTISGLNAAATAVLTGGSVTALNITNPGTGYVAGETVTIEGTTGIQASVTIATVAADGGILSFNITNGGTGYGALIAGTGLRKFVDTLPGLNAIGANNLGQYIPVAVPDTLTYPGSDYYEIAIVEYAEKMHSDLPPTRLRGYVQLATSKVSGAATLANPGPDGLPDTADDIPITLPGGTAAVGVTKAHYLGPLISATKDRPVRIKFYNLLPTGAGGDLFLPTDTSVMGAGIGPLIDPALEPDPQNPQCGVPYATRPKGCFAQNRATLHLHGGLSPWVSDGTPHQWITPKGEPSWTYDWKLPDGGTITIPSSRGVSVKNVPDMDDPGEGAMTFFYTNQQSARLMFYHDHAWGMTRLNVYAGGAAGYVISDDAEKRLLPFDAVNNPTGLGLIPGPDATLPLIIQDKTFVPSDAQLIATDPLWDKDRWGNNGDLWAPHVYVPAQNPGDASGVNQYGRWAYGPWFWPPTNNIDYPPIPNPYSSINNPDLPLCDPNTVWCEPELMPGTPFNSMGMESFHDTPVVNGTAYPKVTVEPKAYRLRILNAANDRFFNLSLYKADPAALTEVQLNPTEVAAALTDPTVFPTPVAGSEGPSWLQIGNEGGFLPAPVVIPPQPTTWVNDPTVFNAGNVDQHSLLLGPAERADVIVDFSAFAGQTLILYNDAPAAFPARDPRYDYYTGNGDYRDTGGAPPTIPGYGPNTRTVMQITVGTTTTTPSTVNPAALATEFAHKTDKSGVFESSQNPIIAGQDAYDSAYGTNFNVGDGLVQIYAEYLDVNTLAGVPLRIPLQRKAIQDEMGEAFDKEYGRMSGNLGLEAPQSNANGQGIPQNLILYPFVNPATEIVGPIALPPRVSLQPISSTTDGTQIWKITHNGVDTHPIHFHLFDVQLLNRVGWDGIVRTPDLNELGWKETVRISPLEDTIVALRPVLPKLPFGLADSWRPLNPAMAQGSTDIFNNTDAFGNPTAPPITNTMTNFEWEYVWHCHILSHEEMDMMRPIIAQVDPTIAYPSAVTYTLNANGSVTLTWSDGTPINWALPTTVADQWGSMANEIGFNIERATVSSNGKVGAYAKIGSTLANVTEFIDSNRTAGTNYRYRVVAYNAAGDTYSAPVGGPAVTPPAAPTNVAAALVAGPQVNLTWRDNANNEAYFLVERSLDSGATWTLIAQVPERSNVGNVTYVDTMVSASQSYLYRVAAVNAATILPPTTFVVSNPITSAALPAAPTGLAATAVQQGKKANVTLTWIDNADNETGFILERATNASFTVGLVSTTLAANTQTTTQTGLYRGVTYWFRIRAINTGGSSGWSNVFSIPTP